MKTALLSRGQIEKVLDMDMVLHTVDEVFKAHGNQEAILPAKITPTLRLAITIPRVLAAVPGIRVQICASRELLVIWELIISKL